MCRGFRLAAATPLLLTLVSAAAGRAQEQTTAKVYGRVLEQGSDRAVAEVRVALEPGGPEALSDAAGRFALTAIPFGTYTMRFERIGYVTRTATLRVGPGEPVDLTVRLATESVELEPIEVVARSAALERVGFFERRNFGQQGTFFTEADIERLRPTMMSDLLRQAPSAFIINGGPGAQLLRFNRQQGFSPTPGCEPAVFLDGMRIQTRPRNLASATSTASRRCRWPRWKSTWAPTRRSSSVTTTAAPSSSGRSAAAEASLTSLQGGTR